MSFAQLVKGAPAGASSELCEADRMDALTKAVEALRDDAVGRDRRRGGRGGRPRGGDLRIRGV